MFVLGSISVLVPLVVVQVYGYSVRVAGLFVLVVTVTMMLSAPPISRLVPRYGARRLIMWGLGLASATVVAAAATLSSGVAVVAALICLLTLGVALGLLQSPSAIVVSSEPSSRGSGVGLYNSVRFGGGVVGVGWLSMAAQVGATTSQALFLAALPIALAGVVVATVHWRASRR